MENIMLAIGLKAFRFMLIFSIIYTVICYAFITDIGYVPDPMKGYIIDVNSLYGQTNELKSSAESIEGYKDLNAYWSLATVLLGTIKTFIKSLLLGYVDLIPSFVAFFNIPALTVFALIIAGIINLALWYYIVYEVWKLLLQLMPIIERIISGLATFLRALLGGI